MVVANFRVYWSPLAGELYIKILPMANFYGEIEGFVLAPLYINSL